MKLLEEKTKDYQLKWFDIVMQEYNSIRSESSESLKNQQSIINYGLTAIGVMIAFSANLWGQETIVELIYVLFIPFMCNLIIFIWNGEIRRMSRAGQYIKTLEDKIQKEFSEKCNISEPALEWETFLRRKPKDANPEEEIEQTKFNRVLTSLRDTFSFLFKKEEKTNKIKSNYIAIILMFGGLSTFSVLLGFVHNYLLLGEQSGLEGQNLFSLWISSSYWWLILFSLILILDFLMFIYHYRYFHKVKK